MSGDEVMVMFVSLGVSAILWIRWVWQVAFSAQRCSRFEHRWPLLVYPAVCAAALWGVLRRFSSFDVQNDPVYLAFYMILGAAWAGLGSRLLPAVGLSARDDVIERANGGAAHAIGGALLGLTFCFAGGNIGDGPGWWVVVFCAFLSTTVFFLLWILLDRFTHLADTVTIDRDPAAGLRLAAYFAGTGLILGRAVAGDWESAFATIADFLLLGWPAIALWGVAVFLEKRLRPHPERPTAALATHGLAPAAIYLSLAIFFTMQAGWWS